MTHLRYLSLFVTPGFVLMSQIYPDFGVRLKTFCNNITNLTRLRCSSVHTEETIKNDNPEKLATWGTQDEEQQNKNTTQYVLNTTMHKHGNSSNQVQM
jgi:hypothetical protein